MAATALTDTEKAVVATLTADHGVLQPRVALRLLRDGHDADSTLFEELTPHVSLDRLLEIVAAETGLDYVDFHASDQPYEVVESVLGLCDVSLLKRLSAIPLVPAGDTEGRTVIVAAANPSHPEMKQYMQRTYANRQVRYALALKSAVDAKLVQYEALERDQADLGEADSLAADATGPPSGPTEPMSPAVEWVEQTLQRAVAEGASDIHLNFDIHNRLGMRMRVDGDLRQYPVPLKGREQSEAVASVLARCQGIDSANLREPADGTFTFAAAGRRIDVRMAMLPQINGPTVVLRLLDPANVQRPLESFGFSETHLGMLRTAVSASQGMVMVCGPTGSGKSTTLYGMLREVDARARNVLTVEDPVEYKLPHINQTQIRSGLGERSLTFARALRSILRLDPDVILVGECRDQETARIALDAAITGHMVLSTVHANDAIQVFTRLIEMGVPPYMVAEALTCAVSQRLVRKVHQCAQTREPTDDEASYLLRYGYTPDRILTPTGCAGCAGSGYRGRIPVLEVLAPTRRLRTLVTERASAEELWKVATQSGWEPIVHDGLRHAMAGTTTVEEIRRVLVESESVESDLAELEGVA